MGRRSFSAFAVVFLVAMSSMLPGGVVYAHHSVASLYDEDHQVMLEGVVTRFTYVNPHPVLMLTVTDAKGRAQVWRLEMDNRTSLAEVGVQANTLQAGEQLAGPGRPARKH